MTLDEHNNGRVFVGSPRLAQSPAMRLKRLIRCRFALSSQAPAMAPYNAMWPFAGRSRLCNGRRLCCKMVLSGRGKASFIACCAGLE